ncbi:4-oxalocrotonate tautomerase [Streptomyces griseocarneus]|nr:4-oxalocrotonate tautomerase [Streptomyces griseocarneus]
MPHVDVRHFPKELTENQKAVLAAEVTAAVQKAFGCDPGVVSIALEPVAEADWNERVYGPAIEGRKDLLIKTPNY